MNKVQEDKLETIQRLLDKAQATEFEAEAEALTARATALMAQYSIDAAMLGARAKVSFDPTKTVIFITGSYAAANQYMVAVIAKAFGAHCVLTNRVNEDGMYVDAVEVYGFESDIDMIRMLYTSVSLQCANLVKDLKGYSAGETRVIRRSFIYGFAQRVGERLTQQRATATVQADLKEQQATANLREDSASGAALVLADRSMRARKALEEDYPKLRKVRRSTVNASAFGAGKRAGDRANLHGSGNVGNRRRTAIA
jgi:hypothetical protein